VRGPETKQLHLVRCLPRLLDLFQGLQHLSRYLVKRLQGLQLSGLCQLQQKLMWEEEHPTKSI